MFFYKTAKDRTPLFYADNRKIIIEGVTYRNSDILDLKVNCILGRIFPVRKHLDRIEELVAYPPLYKLYGSVEINTVKGLFTYPKVYCAMEAYLYFKRIYKGTKAYYTYRSKTIPYRYESSFDDNFFSKRKNFSVLFILDNEKKLERNSLLKMKNEWAEHCGFRTCAPDENCCFNELLIFNEHDRWITIYDDSLEGLSAAGVINQSRISSEEAKGFRTLIISVYNNEAMLIAHGSNKKTDLFFFGDKKYFDFLRCKSEDLSDDYSVLESLCTDQNDTSVKDVLEDESKEMTGRLKTFAEMTGINDYFIRSGFYDIHAIGYYEAGEFVNGYKTENYRIRADESKIPGWYMTMTQGNPSFDILKKDSKLREGVPYTVTALNSGRASTGFAFCIRSREIHNIILSGMRDGNIPVKFGKCCFTSLKKEYDTSDIKRSAVSLSDYAKTDGLEDSIYENTPFEMTYKLIFGQYAFIYEAPEFAIPTGVVFNKSNIKTQQDKENADWLVQRASVSVTFSIKSEVPLTMPVEIMLIPMDNIYGGIGRIITKVYRR